VILLLLVSGSSFKIFIPSETPPLALELRSSTHLELSSNPWRNVLLPSRPVNTQKEQTESFQTELTPPALGQLHPTRTASRFPNGQKYLDKIRLYMFPPPQMAPYPAHRCSKLQKIYIIPLFPFPPTKMMRGGEGHGAICDQSQEQIF
jgi:hypothetical protein